MFSHEGPARSPKNNALLAGYLALVAGYVNSGGFVLLGTFTSHVTGSVGRVSADLAFGNSAAAVFALLLVVSFFSGAFIASLILEGSIPVGAARSYAFALSVEGLLLLVFILVAGFSHTTRARFLDAQAAILCLAMGMQNSLVTRLSGAVIRTTHLTGVLTDLAIEASRWFRWQLARAHGKPLPEMPVATRSWLLLTIFSAFAVGAVLGAVLTQHASRWAMGVPAAAIFVASGSAFLGKRE